jgi:Tfp pilus assembly protein PilO
MIRRLSKREQRVFILTIVTVLVYVSFNWVFKPLKLRIQFMESSIEEKKSMILKHQRIIRRAQAIEEEYDQYEYDFRQDKSNEQVMSSILSEIELIAGDLDLRISDMKPKRRKKEEYFNRFSVSLTIKSELSEILNFLYILQNKPYLFNVDEIRFDKGSRRKDSSVKTSLVLSKILIP